MKIFLLILVIFTADIFPVNFDKAKNLFESGYYSELIEYTNELDKSPQSDFTSSLYRAVSFYRTGKFRESRQMINKITALTSDPEVKDYGLYFLALSEIKLENLVNAVLILSRLTNSSVPEISSNSKTILRSLVHYKLNENELNDLAEEITDKDVISYISQSRNALKILAVLPLSGLDKEAGEELLTGLEFAVNTLKTEDRNIILDVVNSESRISSMTKKVLDRLNSSNYNLVVGELRSNPTAALAGITSLLNIPLLSPTAAANDISSISEYVFQMNTSSYTLGKTIAEYAIDSLKYRTFAILAPLTDDGNESVSGFTETVIEKGCSIISTEWYFDHFNLNRQLQRTRERVLSIDSLDTEEYMSLDSIKTVPAGVIEAFFLPVPNSDIESVLSQVAYYNFSAKTLGTYGWDDLKMLNKLSTNAKDLVFIKESGYDLNNNKYTDFVYKFNRDKNRNPKMLEITGYSVIEMILTLQKENPEISIHKILSGQVEYNSVSGKVVLKDSRTNNASDIYAFTPRSGISRIDYFPKEGKDSLFLAEKYFNTAHVYSVTRQDSMAADYFLKSLQEYSVKLKLPDSLFMKNNNISEIYERLGSTYYGMNDLKSAGTYYAKLLQEYPENKEFVFKHAVCTYEDDPDLAIVTLRDFTNDPEYSAEAYYEIGRIYYRTDDIKSATDYFAIAAELNSKKARRMLDYFEKQKEEKEEIEFEW
ncbi:MAG: ABC transporter substrate-binding protein [Candidatus Delongbacteria bacterium]|nr:ABC transporter substrate-binding protein [Candidatus Delongbacteria bacterium]